MGVAAPEARPEGKVHALAAKSVGELLQFSHFFYLCVVHLLSSLGFSVR